MVRGDVLYGFFPPRLQASIDLTLYIVFFLPGVTALCWAGYIYAGESWAIWEQSSITAEGPPIYPFKTVIPVAGLFILMQGIVEIIRCIRCLKDGKWPSRVEDVEEVDVDKLKEMVHVKDEDIAKLDEFVTAKEGGGDEKRSLVRILHHGHRGGLGVLDAARALADDQRPPGPADAGDDRGGDHARLSHRVHADGSGHHVRLFRLLQPRTRRQR